ncbi:hypothetical protein H310_01614 [Aphanomyces invadans]|uniref:SLC26A/SulP transporter domain-containing protein n=1 Tax=Aphanomyces invadans TaxID=157072 RepID=A0A024UU40_9STRA|nr:hypothetical protein H310_01614 [Aphanomyces invadans]ETW09188.1 hypothetical protein H310_01614 [Aphanomyces invadans]|eukprot:XP_008862993.1 hypothetical protein H310_01614 [Aphanomyces invadans]
MTHEALALDHEMWWHWMWRRLRVVLVEHMPILEWLPGYQWQSHLAHDIVAAVVVVAVMLPQELAFGASMHIPVSTSLRTAIVAPFVYCVCGTSSILSFANAAELTWSIGGALQTIPEDQEFERLAKGTLITVMSGVILLVLGWFRVGSHLPLSRPAMGGFLWGASLLVLAEHVPHLAGVVDMSAAPWHFAVHFEACVLGAFSLAALISVEGIRQRQSVRFRPSNGADSTVLMPTSQVRCPTLHTLSFVDLAPVGVCCVALMLRLWVSFPDDDANASSTHRTHHGNQSLYDSFTVTHAFHHVVSQEVEEVVTLLWDSLIIALTSYISTIVLAHAGARHRLALAPDSPQKAHHIDVDPNKELLAYGVACVIGGSFQALPPAGGLARTAINAKYSHTAVTTLCTTMALIGVLLSKVYILVPLPSLAAIVVVSTVSFMDKDELRTMVRCRLYMSLALWAVACACTFLGGILVGALAALCLSVVMPPEGTSITRLNAIGTTCVAHKPLTENGDDVHIYQDHVMIVRVDAAMVCFANWDGIEKALEQLLNVGDVDGKGSGGVKGLVVDLSNVRDGAHDVEALRRMGMFSRRLKHHDVDLAVTHAPPTLRCALSTIAPRLAPNSAQLTNQSAVDVIQNGVCDLFIA